MLGLTILVGDVAGKGQLSSSEIGGVVLVVIGLIVLGLAVSFFIASRRKSKEIRETQGETPEFGSERFPYEQYDEQVGGRLSEPPDVLHHVSI